MLNAEVDQELCISCGACVSMCPDVFDWNDDQKAHAVKTPVPSNEESCAKEAADGCPTDAIKIH